MTMNPRLLQLILITAALLVGPMTAVGQQIINVPPNPGPGFRGIDGTTILNVFDGGSLRRGLLAFDNTITNLFDGGSISGPRFRNNAVFNMFGGNVSGNLEALDNTAVNISGGRINGEVDLFGGSVLNLSGGEIRTLEVGSTLVMTGGDAGQFMKVGSSATALISGGTIGRAFQPFANSNTIFFGSEFLLDGVPIAGLDQIGDSVPFNLPDDAFFSGVLADGTPIFFSTADGDTRIEDNALTLVRTAAAPPGPANLDVPTHFGGWGVRAGQTVTVRDGGLLSKNYNAGPGSTVILNGGVAGENLEALGAQVTLLDGGIGHDFDAFAGTNVVIENGRVGQRFEAWSGSTVVVNGGEFDNDQLVHGGAAMTINSGRFGSSSGERFSSLPGSLVTINGGQFFGTTDIGGMAMINGGNFVTLVGNESSQIEVHGGSFLRIALRSAEFLMTAGTVVDDRSSHAHDSVLDIRGGTLNDGFSISSGSQLFLRGGEIGDRFSATSDAGVNISGGTIGNDGRADDGAIVTMTDGAIGEDFLAQDGSTINIEGGFVDSGFTAQSGSIVNINGGQIANLMEAESGAIVNIDGGQVGAAFTVHGGAVVEMDGGAVGTLMSLQPGAVFNRRGGFVEAGFAAFSGSTLNVFGQEFTIDGVPISGLDELGDSLVVANRGGELLEGVLVDGTPFQLGLFPIPVPSLDSISPQATLRLTLVPEPGAASLLLIGAGALFACRLLRRRRQ